MVEKILKKTTAEKKEKRMKQMKIKKKQRRE